MATAGLAYGLGNAWGWADEGCTAQAMYMCRVPGGGRQALGLLCLM